MYNVNTLRGCIDLIENEKLKSLIEEFFETVVPDYFWTVPSSSTGKYHSESDQGEGGLVRHTITLCRVAMDLAHMADWEDTVAVNGDEIIAACLLHDSFKYDLPKKEFTVHEHPNIAAWQWDNWIQTKHAKEVDWDEDLLTECIRSHSGQWTESPHSEVELCPPASRASKFVHYCDYIASRKYVTFINDKLYNEVSKVSGSDTSAD